MERLQRICQDIGYHVLGTAATATEARHIFADPPPDVLLTNMDLADDSDGVDVARCLRSMHPNIAVIFITATGIAEKLERIAAIHPNGVLKKPVDIVKLRSELFKATH